MNEKSIFVLTKFCSGAYGEEFLLLLKVLETITQKIKVDTKLPNEGLRDGFSLFLIDAQHSSCAELLNAEIIQLAKNHNIVFFNALRAQDHEQTLLLANVKGVIYKGDEPELTFKGLRRILSGELWYCRKTMSKALVNFVQYTPNILNSEKSNLVNLDVLTTREKSVISLLAKGAKNEDIANTLNISCHTVKSHIYSAFRKTKSRNRIELANWALRFIPAASIITK